MREYASKTRGKTAGATTIPMNAWVIPSWDAVPALAAAGAGVAAWGAMHPAAQLFGPTIRRVPESCGGRAVALTFDDGPNPTVTPRLLDLLDEHGVRATFFLIGRFVRACPGLAREVAARGHSIGNHTDTHPNLIWLSRPRIAEELQRCHQAIAQSTGSSATRWLRPPFGYRGPQLNAVVRLQGYRGVVMWSVIAYDWKPQPALRLIERLRRVRPGDILVLHDGNYRTLRGERQHVVRALEYWLPRWRNAGLNFVTIDDVAGNNRAHRAAGARQ